MERRPRVSQPIMLAVRGRPLASIFIAPDADRVIRFAAEELRKYLSRISGAVFQVQEKAPSLVGGDTPAIVLGAKAEDFAFHGLSDPCSDPFDGFVIRTDGPHLLLLGHNSRSVLYAVYALLESSGCEFVEPGIEKIPRCSTLIVKPLNKTEVCSLPLRNIFRVIMFAARSNFRFLDPGFAVPQIDWMAKRRLNHYEFYVDFFRFDLWEKHKGQVLDALLDRGFDIELTHHSIHYFCPPDEDHDYGNYGPDTYRCRHPEWFVRSPGGLWQTRVDRPAVRRLIIRRYVEFLKRNPELKIASLWGDDDSVGTADQRLNPAEVYLQTFWNKVSLALQRELPEKRLSIFAYLDLMTPPKKVKPHPNQHCWFCPIDRDYRFPMAAARNRHFLPLLRDWCKVMAPYQVGVFEYYGWAKTFIPFHSMMRDDFARYRDLGAAGVYGWAGYTYNLMGFDWRWALDLNILARLLWNMEADVPAAGEAWACGVFGPAGDRINAFYDYIRSRFRMETAKGLTRAWGNMDECEWMSLETARGAQLILAEARKKAAEPWIVRRIDLLEKTLLRNVTEQVIRKPRPSDYLPGMGP